MDSQLPAITETEPAVQACAQLGGKGELLEAAVTGLTAEREASPDYSQTLCKISALLEEMDAAIHDFARSPAMTLTPDDMAAQIAAAGTKARASDSAIIEKAREIGRASCRERVCQYV